MDSQMLDGNAVAGMLQEVFAVEMTNAIETCRGCGASDALGATHVYRGAGTVLVCPHCDNPLVKIVRGDTRMWIGFPGLAMLQLPVV
ncbi:MAG TPA: DUF6510 family protein [Conexibacter sp.]|jgi:hypothetical protein